MTKEFKRMTNEEIKRLTNEEINERIEMLDNKIWCLEVSTDYMNHQERINWILMMDEKTTLKRELREREAN